MNQTKEISEELKEKEETKKKEILNYSEAEIKIETKYIIHFEDHGQDFLEWHIDENGYIIDSKPFQKTIWVGKFTIPQTAEVGKKLAIWLDGESWINYPIRKIEVKDTKGIK